MKQYKAYFARWISDFDCGFPTEWWYCIKDEIVSLEKLSAKQRYRVNRGLKDMLIKKLQQEELQQYVNDLYRVAVDSLNEYPAKYRNLPNKDEFRNDLENVNRDVWICIDRETNTVCGYSFCTVQEDMAFMRLVKVMPSFLKKEVNAALAYKICHYYLNERRLKYVCDGERNIRHETNYQDFLVKVLGFRYAYCRLNVVYHPILHNS